MADQEQVPKKKPDLRSIDVTYAFVKHDGDDTGGVHKVKAKAVDVEGRVVLDADVSHDRPQGNGSGDDDGYWLSVSNTVLAALLSKQEHGCEGCDDTDPPEDTGAHVGVTEEVVQEYFDTLILDRTLRPDEKLGPFFAGHGTVGQPTLNNMLAPSILTSHEPATLRYIEMHIDGDLTDEERRQFVQGTALTICIGDKHYRQGPLRAIDGDDKIRSWSGPLGPDYLGMQVPARQMFLVKHDHSPAAQALLPKLRLFRCVAKVSFVRDLQ